MKYYVLTIAASVAMAQSVSTTYIPDINGRRVEAESAVSKDGSHTEVVQNLNGRSIPLRQSDEKILREDSNTRVVERTIRQYDRNGQLASTERQLVEEQKRPGGSTTRVTTYRTDVNGRMAETERRTTDTETQGSVTKTQTSVEQPGLGGSFQMVEKHSGVTTSSPAGSQSDETVYQASQNGGFVVTARHVTETTHSGNQTTEKTASYQPYSDSGQLRLTEQTTSMTTKRPDGSESVETNYYGSSWNGQARDNESRPQLRWQDVIERTAGPGGSVVESLSVRRPSASDANKLGPSTKVSETVCTGKCRN